MLAWAVRAAFAAALNAELGTDFDGRCAVEIDLTIPVDRERHERAIACHHSQAAGPRPHRPRPTDNPVLQRRLELTGPTEPLRWLRRPPGGA